MKAYDISREILSLLDCDGDEIIDAIFNLARRVEHSNDKK